MRKLINYFNKYISCNIPPVSSDPTPLVTLKTVITNRKSEYARCVAYVPEKVWSRELKSFIITLYISLNVLHIV